jgi:hypothetical protein
MTMNTRHALMVAVAFGHLILVGLGAASLMPDAGNPNSNAAGKALATYGALSGADNGYGFFAPGVAPTMRATFTMSDESGKSWTDVLETGTSHEADLRYAGIASVFVMADFPPSLAQSMAAAMFGRHPTATHVVMLIEVSNPPTMAEYREGKRPQWEPLFQAAFSRDQQAS